MGERGGCPESPHSQIWRGRCNRENWIILLKLRSNHSNFSCRTMVVIIIWLISSLIKVESNTRLNSTAPVQSINKVQLNVLNGHPQIGQVFKATDFRGDGRAATPNSMRYWDWTSPQSDGSASIRRKFELRTVNCMCTDRHTRGSAATYQCFPILKLQIGVRKYTPSFSPGLPETHSLYTRRVELLKYREDLGFRPTSFNPPCERDQANLRHGGKIKRSQCPY
jgi:hypothetical protein